MVLTLSSEQYAAFETRAREGWCKAAAHALFHTYESHYSAQGAPPDALLPMVQTVAAWAHRHDINGKADVTRLCHVAAALGHRFWQDPRFLGYVTTSMAPELPPSRRATAMTQETKSWLRGLWAGDSLQAFAERLAAMVDAGYGPQPHTLQHILPGHWQMFSATHNTQLLEWFVQKTPDDLRDNGPRQLAITACALVHGTQWLDDPQYPNLAKAIRQEPDPARLGARLAQIYADAIG